MIIDSTEYRGVCDCGKEHTMFTELCVIEQGCMKNMQSYLEQYGLQGFCTAIYDENTYKTVSDRRPEVNQEIILSPENLHANEISVQKVLDRLSDQCRFLIAVGSGTIHDITRYCAYVRGISFVSCPTAASVDGYCSSVAAMTWEGCKKTLTAVAPKIVIADLDIIAKAPLFLARSGFGDMVGKFIALADWKIGALLTGEPYCERISNMMAAAAGTVLESAKGISSGSVSAYEQLTYGLLISGLAMQLMGNSRPASGAEHHISHLIEMEPEGSGLHSDALHGEKVGVATILASAEYHRLAEDAELVWDDYSERTEDEIEQVFKASLSPQIMKENEKDAAKGITAECIRNHWPKICQIISEIPRAEELTELYRLIGAKALLTEIGVTADKVHFLLEYSPLVRNRLTLMRLRHAMQKKGEKKYEW